MSDLGGILPEYTLLIALLALCVWGGVTELGLRTRDAFVCYLDMSQSDGDLLAAGSFGSGVYCETDPALFVIDSGSGTWPPSTDSDNSD